MRKSNIFQRFHVAVNFLRYGKGNCRLMTCGKCGSVFIHPISEHPAEGQLINNEKHIDIFWSEVDQCCKCGAVCQEIQLWNFEGDVLKINKDFIIYNKDN